MIQQSSEKSLSRLRFKSFRLKCECSSAMSMLCVQGCGEPSLHCCNPQCNYSCKTHQFCRKENYFLREIQLIEQNFIQRMKNERSNTFSNFIFRKLEKNQISALQEVFLKKNLNVKQGILIDNAFRKLSLIEGSNVQKYRKTRQYLSEINMIQAQIFSLRSQLGAQFSQSSNLLPKSRILNSQQVQECKFILECLNNPISCKLLFRASQHQFSASKFYQHCDRVKNLLVLVKTEHGKIIGGFNPIGWDSRLNGSWSSDNSKKCFLFSVCLRQKMGLLKPQNAIYNHLQYGPLFGNDLQLSDNCNDNQDSYSDFPYHYNSTSLPVKKNAQTSIAFTGSATSQFGVIEYEIFSVVQ